MARFIEFDAIVNPEGYSFERPERVIVDADAIREVRYGQGREGEIWIRFDQHHTMTLKMPIEELKMLLGPVASLQPTS